MPQVSKRFLDRDIEEKLFELFWEVIGDLRSQREIKQFLKDLLTPTEEIVLSKRIAIALMLLKGYDYRSIDETLKVSTTTVGRVALWLKHEGEGYRKVLTRVIRREKMSEFWERIDWGLSKVFPPYRRDWKEFYKQKAAKQKIETPIGRVKKATRKF